MEALKNRVAIITGACGGIGRVTAELFLKEAACVVLTDYKHTESLEELKGQVSFGQNSVLIVKADLTVPSDINNLIETALQEFAKVDILVNNAGIFECVNFEEIGEDDFDKMMDVNMKGLFFLTQRIIPYFKAQQYGKIINIASGAGRIGSASSPHYAMSKAGVIALTKSLARLYGRFNIQINAVAPSLIDTEMLKKIPAERLNNLIESVPLKRLGSPLEVARLILFLAESSSDYITGQTISIDGGITML
jgi:3-oxoacyl-[acyl-carrier protein] reductase